MKFLQNVKDLREIDNFNFFIMPVVVKTGTLILGIILIVLGIYLGGIF